MKKLLILILTLCSIYTFGQTQIDPSLSPTTTRINTAISDAIVTSGTDTYTGSLSGLTAYVSGRAYDFTFGNANTSATPTVNINSIAAVTIKKYSAGSLVSMAANDLKGTVRLRYDGTYFVLDGIGNIGSGGGGGTWGSITGTLSSQTDLQTALDAKLVKASNLSDLASTSTARTNLGLGTLATQSGTFSGTSSGINTGDQTTVSGNAGTATALQTPRTIGIVTGDATSSGSSFDGSANNTNSLTVTKLNGTSLAGLATGILKITTGTGVPSIATPGSDFQSPITLTTTGTIGAATLISNTLNIPQYSGGGGGGTVTATGGSLTSNAVVLGAGTTDTKVSTGITTDGTAQLNLGVNNTTIGKLKMFGSTSGDATILPNVVAGTATQLTLPATSGTLIHDSNIGYSTTTNNVNILGQTSKGTQFGANGNIYYSTTPDGMQTFSSGTVNATSLTPFTFSPGIQTNITASTLNPLFRVNMASDYQWATGNFNTQSFALMDAPTMSAIGASTVKNAATFTITGAPTAGANMTITNPSTLWSQSGYIEAEDESSNTDRNFVASRYTADANAAKFIFKKSRGTIYSPAIIGNSDAVAQFQIAAYDGAQYTYRTPISWAASGTIASGFVPMDMVVSGDISGSGDTEMARFKNTGVIILGKNSGSEVYRLTNGGTNQFANVLIDVGTSISSGISWGFNSTNGLTFNQGNLTRRIASCGIKLSNTTTTAGSEAGGLSFLTQSAGATPVQTMVLMPKGGLLLATSSGATATNSIFEVAGNFTGVATNGWLTSGVQASFDAATYTDPQAGNQTRATATAISIGQPTFSNAGSATITATDAATVYIANSPTTANVSTGSFTNTNTYALWVDNGIARLDGGILGVKDASSAASGIVGEHISSLVSTYTNFTTTATYQQIATISLTAGSWDITADVTFFGNSSTLTTTSDAIFTIATATASATGSVEGETIAYVSQGLGTGNHQTISFAPKRVEISSTTSYYLNGQATFTVGNPQFVGKLRAVRVR